MKNWEDDDTDEYCTSRAGSGRRGRGRRRASASSSRRSISPPSTASASSRISCASTRAGRTPNPDVLCNSEIKFKAFLDHARDAGRRPHRDRALRAAAPRGRAASSCCKAVDATKDQTYFLHQLTQDAARPRAVSARRSDQARGARACAASRASRPTPRRIRPASASSASGRSAIFWRATCRRSRARSRRRRARSSAGITGSPTTRWASGRVCGVGGTQRRRAMRRGSSPARTPRATR